MSLERGPETEAAVTRGNEIIRELIDLQRDRESWDVFRSGGPR